ncbi:MAG: hypothetical protein HY764_03690 [Candidatus Portnoybacteria bacterium]|nr:hypothetical protein [Candidatus Portnoybacteria bacterium]
MGFAVPSGQVFYHFDLDVMYFMAKFNFIRWSKKPIKLSSGIESHIYVSGREDLTDHPVLEYQIGKKITYLIQKLETENEKDFLGEKQICLIGIPTAGTALAQAVAMFSFMKFQNINGSPICHRIMREALKSHGIHQDWVNGKYDPDRHTYWTIDNVITNGQSKFETAKRLEQSGYPAKDMTHLILIDRQQGGVKNMREAGFLKIIIVYNLSDIVYTFGEMKLWTKDRVRAAAEEIAAMQV